MADLRSLYRAELFPYHIQYSTVSTSAIKSGFMEENIFLNLGPKRLI